VVLSKIKVKTIYLIKFGDLSLIKKINGYMFGANSSTFSATNRLRIDLTVGRYTFCILIKLQYNFF